jgi:hypothetical protein
MPTAVKWVDCVQELNPCCRTVAARHHDGRKLNLIAPANGCSLQLAPDQVEGRGVLGCKCASEGHLK